MNEEAARLFDTANQLRNAGRLDEAIAAYERAVEISPDHVGALINLGTVWAMKTRWKEAAAAYRRAVALRPDIPELLFNLGNALECDCRWEEALTAFRQAVNLRPNDAGMQDHVGVVLYYLGKLDEAEAAHRLALKLSPDLAMAHCNLSSVYLLRGDQRQGYREWEWRLRFNDPIRTHERFTSQNQWRGEDLAGRRILLQTEGGHGDAIQHFRYAPRVSERGGRVIVRCHPDLAPLLKSLDGVREVVSTKEPPPEFDLHCPICSLPAVFDTTLQTIPAAIPYLHPDAADVARWKTRFAALSDRRLNVGLVWSGGENTAYNRVRSMKLADFAPLGRISGMRYFSLQLGGPAAQALAPPDGLELTDWTSDLHNWSDTAAMVQNLDLLVTVDTAIAHLAGALGKRVWLLLQQIPAPRWMLDRKDSPWYPTMRIFRQERYFDWKKCVEDAASELRNLVEKAS
jgi:tetratricopeptide (TPR) repeat protein